MVTVSLVLVFRSAARSDVCLANVLSLRWSGLAAGLRRVNINSKHYLSTLTAAAAAVV